MSIYQDSAADLAALVSQAAGTTVTADQLTFTTPTAPAQGESTKNTKLWAICKDTAPVKGRKVVFYDRLNLARMDNPAFAYESISMDSGGTVYNALTTIRDATGITFTQADLEETPVLTDDEGNISVVVRAKATSLGFTGEFLFKAKPWPHISTIFTSDQLIGF